MNSKPTGDAAILTCFDGTNEPGSEHVGAMLGAEVAARFGPRDEKPLSILAHGSDGALAGGVNGGTHWGWLYIRHFWVAEPWRKRGLGRALLTAAEAEARARGCAGVYLDTFSPEAEAFYKRCGYERFGALEDFPPGHARAFLRKRLTDGA